MCAFMQQTLNNPLRTARIQNLSRFSLLRVPIRATRGWVYAMRQRSICGYKKMIL
jgi:hypothetical protein